MSDSPSGLPAVDRRAFLWGAAVVTAVPIITEGGLAQARLSAAGFGVPPAERGAHQRQRKPPRTLQGRLRSHRQHRPA